MKKIMRNNLKTLAILDRYLIHNATDTMYGSPPPIRPPYLPRNSGHITDASAGVLVHDLIKYLSFYSDCQILLS